MDRRSWLWRRKSSEKSPSGETESSGSLSSHSERFSDDQTLSNHNTRSPEVTSKADAGDEPNDSVKVLSEKLSEALLEIRAKEDLVKQHAKVAEEAVSGWERAENEVLVVKRQVDALTQKNSVLEERVGQLDGALKECLRQLRQAREEQEEKIYDAVIKRSSEWESTKSKLENQLVELRAQLQNARTDASSAVLADVRSKLEAAEKENSILKLQLLSKADELELSINERDLSTRAAEAASKQHLDSLRKVSKLEAECRRLKAVAQKANFPNERSATASSVYSESVSDSQSDSGERRIDRENERSLGRSFVVPSVGMGIMDDFLDMERLAGLRKPESRGINDGESQSREMEALISRAAELEQNLKKMEMEKVSLEIDLKECRIQLKNSEDQLRQTQVNLVELRTQLDLANEAKTVAEKEVEFTKMKLMSCGKILNETEVKVVQIQNQLTEAKQEKSIVEMKLNESNIKRTEAESKLKVMELELQTLQSSIRTLEEEVDKERNISREALVKSEILEAEVSRTNMIRFKRQLTEANKEKNILERKLHEANIKKTEAESKLKSMELELQKLQSSIRTLEKEVNKERNISREALAKSEILDAEISRMKLDSQFQRSTIVEEFKINQDKELEVAASKFAECQKTIASLGRQLKSLANFDDLLIESEQPEAVF